MSPKLRHPSHGYWLAAIAVCGLTAGGCSSSNNTIADGGPFGSTQPPASDDGSNANDAQSRVDAPESSPDATTNGDNDAAPVDTGTDGAALEASFDAGASAEAGDGGGYAVDIASGVANVSGAGQASAACAVTAAGTVECWSGTATPSQVPTLTGDAVSVSFGGFGEGYNYQSSFACVVTNVGGVWCWGANAHGELGDGSTNATSAPVPVSGLQSGVKSVSAGQGGAGATVCAVTSSGQVWCWGYNGYGVLGNGSTASASATPVQLTGFAAPATAISVGSASACVVEQGGGVECWGSNGAGQLGNGSTTSSAAPVHVTGLASAVTAVSVGNAYACAIVNGAAQCWGNNGYGATQSPSPVMGLSSGVTGISVGGSGIASCAVVNGAAECWGDNSYGELGDNSTTNSAIPVAVNALTSGVAAVSVGFVFGCALTTSGQVWCWNGHANTPSVPVRIASF